MPKFLSRGLQNIAEKFGGKIKTLYLCIVNNRQACHVDVSFFFDMFTYDARDAALRYNVFSHL